MVGPPRWCFAVVMCLNRSTPPKRRAHDYGVMRRLRWEESVFSSVKTASFCLVLTLSYGGNSWPAWGCLCWTNWERPQSIRIAPSRSRRSWTNCFRLFAIMIKIIRFAFIVQHSKSWHSAGLGTGVSNPDETFSQLVFCNPTSDIRLADMQLLHQNVSFFNSCLVVFEDLASLEASAPVWWGSI